MIAIAVAWLTIMTIVDDKKKSRQETKEWREKDAKRIIDTMSMKDTISRREFLKNFNPEEDEYYWNN